MWETQHSIADGACSKTRTLLTFWRTRNQHQVVSCVFMEVELDVQEVNFSLAQFYRVRLFPWMLDCVWMVCLLLICGT